MKDIFSIQAEGYAKYRPDYPQALFAFILNYVKEKNIAWDCATGNGQTAKELAKDFGKVYATDISPKQLNYTEKASNIFYSLQSAEQTNFENSTFDLITVSQALHWLQFDKFYTEAKRVAKPGAWIAVWMYELLKISPEIDELINQHHSKTLAICWEYERKYVDDKYTTIPFPFKEIICPSFQMQYEWTIEELDGYLHTWSALQKFIATNDYDPVGGLVQEIKQYWRKEKMNIVFPLHLRMGQIAK